MNAQSATARADRTQAVHIGDHLREWRQRRHLSQLDLADNVAIPFKMRLDGDVLSFISTTMIFGTPVDITLSELALETFFPADDLTAKRMRAMAADLK
jgi:hypothetical protein